LRLRQDNPRAAGREAAAHIDGRGRNRCHLKRDGPGATVAEEGLRASEFAPAGVVIDEVAVVHFEIQGPGVFFVQVAIIEGYELPPAHVPRRPDRRAALQALRLDDADPCF
jgi:hypothetical protein